MQCASQKPYNFWVTSGRGRNKFACAGSRVCVFSELVGSHLEGDAQEFENAAKKMSAERRYAHCANNQSCGAPALFQHVSLSLALAPLLNYHASALAARVYFMWCDHQEDAGVHTLALGEYGRTYQL